jgi:hypothetical protein
MGITNRYGTRCLLTCAAFIMLSYGGAAVAYEQKFDAGQACDFTLQIAGSGGHGLTDRAFFDKNGNLRLYLINAGSGMALTFTNLDTGASLSLDSTGSVETLTPNADGSMTLVAMGHNVIIMFPTDSPPGPSTTLYVGRVVISVGDNSTFTLQRTSGTATDICAALSN